jgi:aminopeptidase N
MTNKTARNRLDYQAPAYHVSQIDLTFELDPLQTRVVAATHYQKLTEAPLVLDGQLLQLVELTVDGKPWPYQRSDEQLVLTGLPAQFVLEITTLLAPAENSALEGLYLSNGAYCTQCEAEGFRRITYYQDRPDVMAVFTTHIVADTSVPFLLSNGNLIDRRILADGRQRVSWHDPFPKPCYLFALVAGDFDELTDTYQTATGREVSLRFYVDRGNAHQATFALQALKRAMAFDEQRFGLVYDLDIYMVVAVDFFNMGAMENKGLNIFNSKYVLADASTATDYDYFLIESIIGHEYFHNWTGNRVTCRDWFQLSLKEGLTVFRDQEFSAAMGSAALCRIDAIKTIRTAQFAEDAGPMAHPIRPERVEEMNNFYTVTVYDKGAEVIRMQQSLLGEAGFRKGMDLYFQRHDGQAVTCDDFVQAMQDANQYDLGLFRRWYSQSGTPEVSARFETVSESQHVLHVSQYTPPTADQQDKEPLLIPLRYELHDSKGQVQTGVLQLNSASQTFDFSGLSAPLVPVLLADFSAPVKLHYDYSLSDLLYLVAHAKDAVARWDAMQTIWLQLIEQSVHQGAVQPLPQPLLAALQQLIRQPLADRAFCAELLTMPAYETLAERFAQIPHDMLLLCLDSYQQQLADSFAADWLALYQQFPMVPYAYEQTQSGTRALRNTALHYLILGGNGESVWTEQWSSSDNMTDKLAVLQGLVKAQHPATLATLEQLLSNSHGNVLVFDKFAQLCGRLKTPEVWTQLERVSQLPPFDWHNPNRVRALYLSFAMLNPLRFHQSDGRGYQTLARVIQQADAINPQLASRLVTPLLGWRRFDSGRAALMHEALRGLQQNATVSPDLAEKLSKALAG